MDGYWVLEINDYNYSKKIYSTRRKALNFLRHLTEKFLNDNTLYTERLMKDHPEYFKGDRLRNPKDDNEYEKLIKEIQGIIFKSSFKITQELFDDDSSEDDYDDYGYNYEGYNRYGYDDEGYNALGFNSKGYDHNDYDRSGYNKEGFNSLGYDQFGHHKIETIDRDKNGINDPNESLFTKLLRFFKIIG
jgi:hypothetical protein